MLKSLLVIGSTGFVGKRFIKEIIPYVEKTGINLMATGRNQTKLEKLVQEFPNVNFRSLDVLDAVNVAKKVRQNQIVVNCAGPFDLYGENVVAACAKNGIHYLDITGEVVFGRRMIEKYDNAAKKTGALIIPFAGFDSVPSDMCVFLASNEFHKKYNQPIESIDLVFSIKGGINGGTIATALDMNQKISREELMNRNFMIPGSSPFLQDDLYKARYLPETKEWVAPFFMEPINSKVVYRSLFLLNDSPNHLKYRESIRLPGGAISAWIMARSLKTGQFFLKSKLIRQLAALVLPAPGTGPSEKMMENGFFKIDVLVRGLDKKILKKKMISQGDPGNKSTVKILMACAKSLIEKNHFKKGGLLTPVAAFREKLLPYLERENIEWK